MPTERSIRGRRRPPARGHVGAAGRRTLCALLHLRQGRACRETDRCFARGIAVRPFDFTGLGSSEGDFANSTFASNVADLVHAAEHLRETRKAPAILIGHSLGGTAIPDVTIGGAGIPRCKALVRQGRRSAIR